MEKGKMDKILSIIKEIEKKNLELIDFVLNLPIISRKNMLKEISQDIIKNNKLFHELGISKISIPITSTENEPLIIQSIIEDTISNIQANPSKKVIYIRKFLNFFEDISEKDKDVIFKSLKDAHVEDLKDKMFSLANVFNIKI